MTIPIPPGRTRPRPTSEARLRVAPPRPHALRARLAPPPPRTDQRPTSRGKFLFLGDEKLLVRGVTYGTFPPDDAGDPYPDELTVERDFSAMAMRGINAVRTYTAPPLWVLDLAQRHGLRVLVGLAWESHVAFLDERGRAQAIVDRLRAQVRPLAGHPAILAFAVGNEIPAGIVRWHGARRIERFLARLARVVRQEDSRALVTYVNYPTTEYLHLPFLDFVCFNVFLERQKALRDYVAHLQHVAGERPLLLTEVGLDSRRHGLRAQARAVDWQVRTAFAGGCAGAFVFAWTDAWHRGGLDVEDWDFGLVDRQRRAKPALRTVGQAFAEAPYPQQARWPRISVVVCSKNGSRTIRSCLQGLARLDYPDFEVIVVDDGSTDGTGDIAVDYGFRIVRTEGCGLGEARNLGLSAATGEIVAYIDDDAFPDPDWLTYLAASFMSTPHAAVGGPNITPPEDGWLAACVANAPGGPIHVLLSDHLAEHIPGCNMAFRRDVLAGIGGFDPRFRTAGDDVDVCWRLQDAGWTLGFNPAAMVWHHRRRSFRAYWRQQVGYGRAEALLEQKWPEKYNHSGHLTWSGRLYNNGHFPAWRRGRVYQGVWGSAPFQSVYGPAPSLWWSLPAMPEWHLGVAALAALAALGVLWTPLLATLPLLAVGLGLPIAQAAMGGARASFPFLRASGARLLGLRVATAALYAAQPLARLAGRIRHGLTPWRRQSRAVRGLALPFPRTRTIWSERWREPVAWLEDLEGTLRACGLVVRRGGPSDGWDLEGRFGTLASIRVRGAVEEHGRGRQQVRFLIAPSPMRLPALGILLFGLLSIGASLHGAGAAAAILAAPAVALGIGGLWDASTGTAAALAAARRVARAADD